MNGLILEKIFSVILLLTLLPLIEVKMLMLIPFMHGTEYLPILSALLPLLRAYRVGGPLTTDTTDVSPHIFLVELRVKTDFQHYRIQPGIHMIEFFFIM